MSEHDHDDDVAELIRRSSLGTPAAGQLQQLADDAEVLQVLGRAGYRPPGSASGGRTAGPRPLLKLATELWSERTPGVRQSGPRPQPELGTELWTAIGGGGMDICFQPKVEMATGIVRGAEALVRWYHPRLGRVRPAKLVRFAERIGAIRPLTMWVLQEALTAYRTWRDHGWDLGVAVNLPASVLVDRRLTGEVAQLIEEVGVPPTSLTFEVTETVVVDESPRSAQILQDLTRMGIRISCDDFGTGYASLARLRRLPICEIKVDRSFVCRMAGDDTDRAITRSVLSLGRGLGLTTVAEGVEDREGWDILRAFGCDHAQGFLVSRPLQADRFIAWMARQPRSAQPPRPVHHPPAARLHLETIWRSIEELMVCRHIVASPEDDVFVEADDDTGRATPEGAPEIAVPVLCS